MIGEWLIEVPDQHGQQIDDVGAHHVLVPGRAESGRHRACVLVLVARALDEEVATLEPLERDAARHDGVDLGVDCLGGPGADEGVERGEDGISVGHVPQTIPPPATHRSAVTTASGSLSAAR